jgi:hypothetical protein
METYMFETPWMAVWALFRPVKTWSRAAAGGLPPLMSVAAMVSIPSLAAARPLLAVATAVLTAGSLNDHAFRTVRTRWNSTFCVPRVDLANFSGSLGKADYDLCSVQIAGVDDAAEIERG